MGGRPPRPCIQCGQLTQATRCPRCEQQKQAKRNAGRTHYQAGWQSLRDKVKADHIARHGYWCPGIGVPAHPALDLTVDHQGGRDSTTHRVLCRSCNARDGAQRRYH